MANKKVKIIRNVIHAGRLLKAGEVHDLEAEHAERLIEGEHADEHKAGKKSDPKPEDGDKK